MSAEFNLHALEPGEAPVSAEEFEEHGKKRELRGLALKIIVAPALVFSTYQLIVAAFAPLSSLVMRSLHVGFLAADCFPVVSGPQEQARTTAFAWYDWSWALAGFALTFYHWIFEADLIQRMPATRPAPIWSSEPSWSCWCSKRPAAFSAGAADRLRHCSSLYGLFGQYLPGAIAHRGYGFGQIVGQLYLGTEGIFGMPTLVSATYIFLFILFGAFLEQAGMINLFNAIALGLVGHARGGPAKVAVISSGFMGTISGSGVANVLTVGQFTIPLMKRFGYTLGFAGAVEATASMGGQIMPPVMGAVAFIMAETLNVPYVEIVKAAVIPAVLYYVTAFWMVHLEAGRAG